jgi:hypothetical protein
MYLLVANSHSQGPTPKVNEYQLQLSESRRSNQDTSAAGKRLTSGRRARNPVEELPFQDHSPSYYANYYRSSVLHIKFCRAWRLR